jgi:hypothetical protein
MNALSPLGRYTYYGAGLHRDLGIEGLPNFEVEIRRRLWCLLYVWDW